MIIKYDKAKKNDFLEKLKKLNKRLSKYNQKIETLSTISKIEKRTSDIIDPFDPPNHKIYKVEVCESEISEPEILGKQKVTFLGIISIKNGIKEIFNNKHDENIILGNILKDRLTCDHCNIKRYRTKFFIFKDAKKEIKIIGSSCVDEWFGLDIRKALETYSSFVETIEREFSGSNYCPMYDLSSLILNLTYVTKMFNLSWKSLKDYDNNTMKDIYLLKDALKSSNYYDKEVIQDYKNYIEKNITNKKAFLNGQEQLLIDNYEKMVPQNDFEHNIKNNLFFEDGTLRDDIKSPGIVCYAIWKVNNDSKLKKVEDNKEFAPSEHIGNIGDRIELKLNCFFIKEIDSIYGSSYLIAFKDENGNNFKSYYSGTKINFEITKSYDLKGTVKKHELYKGVKTTVLNRLAKNNSKETS